jgi:soluble lytic murein transglycosylase-like protein
VTRSGAFCGALALVATLMAAGASSAPAAPWPSTYDATIQDAWETYHPGRPWQWWKAQLWQESRLDPLARSPVGALGLAQFMPRTADEIWKAMGYGVVDRRLAEPSIRAGAFYMRRLVMVWKGPRTDLSRLQLAQASYNAGAGSLIKAQKRCGGPREYTAIVACLPMVTGRFSRETTTYVARIDRWRRMMQ